MDDVSNGAIKVPDNVLIPLSGMGDISDMVSEVGRDEMSFDVSAKAYSGHVLECADPFTVPV